MASTLVKLVASNLLRARPVASSSRFFNTKAFQYVQPDSKDECILKRDEELFTVAQAAINHAFDPRVSPAGNLARLLNTSDELIGFLNWPKKFPRWTAVEDDKALYILRNMTGSDNIRKLAYGDSMTGSSVSRNLFQRKSLSAIHENDVKESVPKSEFMSETEIHEKVIDTVLLYLRDLRPFIDLMRGVKSEPCEYYYHVMHGSEEIDSFAESILGIRVSANLRVCSVLQNPKAVYIVAGVDAQDTSDVYGGYVYEIFVDDSLYNIRNVENEMDHTSEIWKITIPKKKGERTQRISGNLIFYREEKICKPTLWQPK
ncbi:hypothetical protein Tco_1420227 [Tanacetum coccineum]